MTLSVKTGQVSCLQQNPQSIILLQVSLWTFCHGSFFQPYTGQGWFGSEHISQVTCSFFGSGPWMGRERQEFSHACNTRCQWSPGTQENNLSIFKGVRRRMESILFSSNLNFLSYVFVQLSHLKAQQIIFQHIEMLVEVLVSLALFALFLVRHYWQALCSYENILLLVTSPFPCSAQLIRFAGYTDPFLILFNTGSYWKQNWDPFSLNIYR